MIDFDCSFLVGTAGVTIIDACPAETIAGDCVVSVFDLFRVGKLTAVVGYDHGKQLVKQFSAKAFIQPFENVDHGLGCVGIPQKSQHQG